MQEIRDLPLQSVVGRLFTTDSQVGFTQCDANGHMNTAAFLELAINHRMSEVLDFMGLDTVRQAKERGIVYLIRKVEMDLQAPASHGEHLLLESWIDQVHASRMIVKVRIRRRHDRKTCCLVVFTATTMNTRKGVLIQIPETFPSHLHSEDFLNLPWAEGHPRPPSENSAASSK
ncbi:MAG: acyl-CoA thioesterase [Planctomycetota bacterium]|nr:MAG: acyl-CoA thioesterase [Planctomycetota bacterium]